MSANNLWLRWAAFCLFGLIATPYVGATGQATAHRIYEALLRGETVAILQMDISMHVNFRALTEEQKTLYYQFRRERALVSHRLDTAIAELDLTEEQAARLIRVKVRYKVFDKLAMIKKVIFQIQLERQEYYDNFVQITEDEEGITQDYVNIQSYDEYQEYLTTQLTDYIDKNNIDSLYVTGDVDDYLLPSLVSDGLESGAIKAKISVDPDLIMPYHTSGDEITGPPRAEFETLRESRAGLVALFDEVAGEHPQLKVELRELAEGCAS